MNDQKFDPYYSSEVDQDAYSISQGWSGFPQYGEYPHQSPNIFEPQQQSKLIPLNSTDSNGSQIHQYMSNSYDQVSPEVHSYEAQYLGHSQNNSDAFVQDNINSNYSYPHYSSDQISKTNPVLRQGSHSQNPYYSRSPSEPVDDNREFYSKATDQNGNCQSFSTNYFNNSDQNTNPTQEECSPPQELKSYYSTYPSEPPKTSEDTNTNTTGSITYGQSYLLNDLHFPIQTQSPLQGPVLNSDINQRPVKKRSSPEEIKSYYDIQKKQSCLKMKTIRKKRANPDAPIPNVDRNKDNVFTCRFGNCGHIFKRRSNIIRHMETMHEAHYIICCHRLFPTKMHFEEHRLTIHKDGHFLCTISRCGRKFSRKVLLHRHEARFHYSNEIPTLICSVCLAYLPKPEEYRNVIKEHAILHSCSTF